MGAKETVLLQRYVLGHLSTEFGLTVLLFSPPGKWAEEQKDEALLSLRSSGPGAGYERHSLEGRQPALQTQLQASPVVVPDSQRLVSDPYALRSDHNRSSTHRASRGGGVRRARPPSRPRKGKPKFCFPQEVGGAAGEEGREEPLI